MDIKIEREIYAGLANGFFDKENFTSVMKLMHAQGEGGAGSLSEFKLDGVRVEYYLTYTMKGPNQVRIKLVGPKQKVDWLEQIIETERTVFGKKK